MKNVNFSDLALSQELHAAVADMGFTTATPIQSEAIPHLLAGRDLIGQAQTGTGKTAAFGIPLLANLPSNEDHVAALVVCPTRELAIQVAVELRKLAKHLPQIGIAAIYGGDSIQKQIRELKRGIQVVVGTPGRIMDHLERGTLSFAQVQTVVLDEADEMLNMGFREDIENILRQMPASRQTVLFSATMPKPILDIARNFQRDPVHVKVVQEKLTNNSIEQLFYETTNPGRSLLIARLFDLYDLNRAVVFTNTKRNADELAGTMQSLGLSAKAIHGDLNQTQRNAVLNAFRDGGLQLLVATDVAARGIDVSNVDAVFNYDIPLDPEYYVHRIGRTGRAGNTGMAFSFVTGRKDFYRLSDIERYTKARIEKRPIPTHKEVQRMKKQRFMEQIASLVNGSELTPYLSMVEEFNNQGISHHQLAAALLKMQMPIEKNTPEIPDLPLEETRRPNRSANQGGGQKSYGQGRSEGPYKGGSHPKKGGNKPRHSRYARA